jgi:four helix bundle protein
VTSDSDRKKTESFRDLVVWQKAMALVKEVYTLAKKLPTIERYALSDQLRRAVVSIPSNIAEGQDRYSSKEFARFLSIARGSKAEVQTQLLICVDLEYFTSTDIETAMALCNEIGKMLSALIQKLTIGD